MCRGQNNSIFRIELILGTKPRNLSPILGQKKFFFNVYLNLETKFNRNGLKMPRFLKNFKMCRNRTRNRKKVEKHLVRPFFRRKVLLISKQDQTQLQTNSVCVALCVYSLLIHLLRLCDKYQENTKMQLWSIFETWFYSNRK